MAEHSDIEWTDATWNVAVGCQKISPGCAHCYAERVVNGRLRGEFGRLAWHQDRLRLPMAWRKPRRVFVNALSDLWWDQISDRQRDEMFAVMAIAHWHTYQILTKRAKAMHTYFAAGARQRIAAVLSEWGRTDLAVVIMIGLVLDDTTTPKPRWPLPNVHLGISAEDQDRLDERYPWLMRTEAAVRFLSLEPLLADIDLDACQAGVCTDCKGAGEGAGDYLADDGIGRCESCAGKGTNEDNEGVDWIIAGGESQKGARPMRAPWARHVRDWCQHHDVPFHFKQWGIWREVEVYRGAIGGDWFDDIRSGSRRTSVHHITGKNFRWSDVLETSVLIRMKSKKQAGRELDGRTWDEQPRQKGQTGHGGTVSTA